MSLRYLRQRLQSRLASILLQRGKYDEAIRCIEVLMREVKQLDDKQLLVELHLVESQIHHKVRRAACFLLPCCPVAFPLLAVRYCCLCPNCPSC